MIGEGDVSGITIGVRVYDNGSPFALGGSCVGKIVRADGATVQLPGFIDGNLASVVLDQTSCAIEGPIQVAVCWVGGSNVTTLLLGYGAVVHTQTGNAIQPSEPIPDLTQLLAEIDNMRQATAAAEAAASKSVRYDAVQTLTDNQKATARENISAAGSVNGLVTILYNTDFEQGAWSANSKPAADIKRIRSKNRLQVKSGDIISINPNGLYFAVAIFADASSSVALQSVLWVGGTEEINILVKYTGVMTVTAANGPNYNASTSISPIDFVSDFVVKTSLFIDNSADLDETITLDISNFTDGLFTSDTGQSYAALPWSRTNISLTAIKNGLLEIEITPYSGLRAGYIEFTSAPIYSDLAPNGDTFVGGTVGAVNEVVRATINPSHYYIIETNTQNLTAANIPAIKARVSPESGLEQKIDTFSLKTKSKCQGKFLSVMGDSISSYNEISPSGTGYAHFYPTADVQSRLQMWWSVLASQLGLNVLKINANAGSTVSTANSSRIECSADARISALGAGQIQPDIIICACGLNDFYYNAALGAYDGTQPISADRSTFKNAYAYMLNGLQANYPAAEIYCCTIAQNVHSGYKTIDDQLETVVNSGGQRLIDYNAAIRDVAKMFGCHIIEMESCGFNLHNLEDYTVDASPNCFHPNIQGHYMMAMQANKDII
jgi:hypothetical protein